MPDHPPLNPRCLFAGWVLGWACWVYVASLMIAFTGLSPLAAQHGLAIATFQIADEVAPFVKISFGAVFGMLALARRWWSSVPTQPHRLPDALAAIQATLLILVLLPADWSRGFGIGLAGTRLNPALLTIYLVACVCAALVLNFVEQRCRR